MTVGFDSSFLRILVIGDSELRYIQWSILSIECLSFEWFSFPIANRALL